MTGPRRPGARAPPNSLGFEAPEHSFLPQSEDLPPIACPASERKRAMCAAILLVPSSLDEAVTRIVLKSCALKAWFAFRDAQGMSNRRTQGATWTTLRATLDTHSLAWSSEYQASTGGCAMTDTKLGDMSPTELQARAIFSLFRQVRHNRSNTVRCGQTPRYHPYYQTDCEKQFLAYRLLLFLNYHTSPSRPFSITAQRNLVGRWLQKGNGQIGKACEELMETHDWDPRMNTETPFGDRHTTSIESSDDEEQPSAAQRDSAETESYANEEQVPAERSDAALQSVSMRTDASHPLLLLEAYVHELDQQTANNARLYFACVMANNPLAEQAKVELMAAFAPLEQRNVETWERSLSLQDIFADANLDNRAILRLEPYVDDLRGRESDLARMYFEAIHNNSSFAELAMSELGKLFEPLERRTAEE